jgi:hypothetical protein
MDEGEEYPIYPEIPVEQVSEDFRNMLLALKNKVADVTIISGEIDDEEKSQRVSLADDYQDILTGIYLMITGLNKLSIHINKLLQQYINNNEDIMNIINTIRTNYDNNGRNRNIPYSNYLKNSLNDYESLVSYAGMLK